MSAPVEATEIVACRLQVTTVPAARGCYILHPSYRRFDRGRRSLDAPPAGGPRLVADLKARLMDDGGGDGSTSYQPQLWA